MFSCIFRHISKLILPLKYAIPFSKHISDILHTFWFLNLKLMWADIKISLFFI